LILSKFLLLDKIKFALKEKQKSPQKLQNFPIYPVIKNKTSPEAFFFIWWDFYIF
jgi:hypothetical protein